MKNFPEQPKDMNRRVFIEGLGYVSLGLIFSSMFGGCESLLDQIKNRPVRRRLRTGSPEVDQAIATYKDAVNQMKALPSSNPRSWAAQATIHGTCPCCFNFCQHGTDHFFSWHRAYLVYFERICQELTGEKKFGLPYWNWNQNPALHPEFTNASSPLFNPRNNTTVAGNPAFSNSTLNTIFGDNNFFSFGSQIEGTPHNTGHTAIGGTMGSFCSALDPLFWAHHCMVDYCWAKWNIELDNDNTNDAAWINTSWDHFVDGAGNPVNVTAGITILMPFLSYRYETSAVGGFSAAAELTARSSEDLKKIEERLRKGADIRFDIKKRVPIAKGAKVIVSRPYSSETQVSADDFKTLIESDQRAERIFVRINYAQLPPVSDFFVRVFINLPNANAQTPTDDIHYAGSFAFFGAHTADHSDRHGKTDFLVNVTETLQNLRRRDQLSSGAPISVQLVAVPAKDQFTRADTELTLEEIEFIISPVIVPRR
jgi:tyrosinase